MASQIQIQRRQLHAMLALLALLPLIPTAVLLRERLQNVQSYEEDSVGVMRQVYSNSLEKVIEMKGGELKPGDDPEQALASSVREVFGSDQIFRIERVDQLPKLGENEIERSLKGPFEDYRVRIVGMPAFSENNVFEEARASAWKLPVLLFVGSVVMAATSGWVLLRRLRLEDLRSDLLSMFSHEVKTPLAGIRVILDSLENMPEGEKEKRQDYYQLLRQENARLARFLDNFLTANRLERGEVPLPMRPVSVSELIEQAADVMRPIALAGDADLVIEVPGKKDEIVGSPDPLVTVFTNLIDNGLKYGGDPPRVVVKVLVDAESAIVEVSDNGKGIPEDERRRVLRRFYQVDQRLSRTNEGCGLGLSICRSLVRGHDGKLEIEDAPEGGALIRVTLPR